MIVVRCRELVVVGVGLYWSAATLVAAATCWTNRLVELS
jgi:hypothetical protein